MRRHALRYLALLLIVAIGAAASVWFGRSPSERAGIAQAGTGASEHVFHVDVAGWYETTPDECVVVSPYDLRLDALPTGLPMQMGDWRGEELGPDEEITKWYGDPEIVLRRRYEAPTGQVIWVTAIGSRGAKSFRLFEHTPHICYDSTSWSTLVDDTVYAPLSEGGMAVRRGMFSLQDARQLVYYWYQWDSPEREAGKGVTSWRLTMDIAHGVEATEERLRAFLALFFEKQLPWHRF